MHVDRRAMMLTGMMMLAASAPTAAEEIYRSVDRNGHVSYSNTPAPDAVRTVALALPDEPSAEEVLAAEEQLWLVQSLGTALEQERKQREQERARRAAEEQATRAPTIVYVPVPVYVESVFLPPPAVHPPRAKPPIHSILPRPRPPHAKSDR